MPIDFVKVPIVTSELPKPPYRMGVVGSSGSGKTNVIKNLFLRPKMLSRYHRPNDIFVFAKTLDVSGDYDPFETVNKFNEFDPELIIDIMTEQKRLVSTKNGKAPQIVMIFDDFASDPRFWSSPVLTELCMSGRHLNISVVMIVQRWHALPRGCRLNLNMILWFRSSNQSEIDQVSDEMVLKKKKKDFVSAMEEVFEVPFAFVVFHLHNNSRNRLTKGFTPVSLDFQI
jgi:hypothetical protein